MSMASSRVMMELRDYLEKLEAMVYLAAKVTGKHLIVNDSDISPLSA